MSEATIQVNRDTTPQVYTVGHEKTRAIIIDNFATDTRAIIDHACDEAEFSADETSAYPGLRAPLTRAHVLAELSALHPLLRKVYAVPFELPMRTVNAAYSLVSTPESDLKVLQRLPHIDSTAKYYFAITHYLAPGEFGGTGLYRHRPTGFETVTKDRLAEYVEAGNAFLAEHGEPPPQYFGDSDEHYELFDRIEYRPNRLVIYPGYLLHSGLVRPERDLSPDPRTGRLTSNVFVIFQQQTTASRD